jgi:hypothetical protein
MKLTPITSLTFIVSISCCAVGVIALLTGHFATAAIFGLGSSINLLAGIMLKKY